MKRFIKPVMAAMIALALSAQVYAAPVSLTLLYDGKNHTYNAEEIQLYVNGKPAQLTLMPPIILNGRTYVPSREVFEPLGATVDWKDAAKELYIGYNGSLIVLKPDEPAAEVNGRMVRLENPAKIINNKLMIPARFVAEELGIPVDWNDATRTVSIGVNEPPPIYEPQQTPETPSAPVIPAAPVAAEGQSVDMSPAPLSEISGGHVEVTGFKADGATFTIAASGPMTRVDKLLLPENKLVLDIYNATNALSQSSYAPGSFSGVLASRNSQFQNEPVKIARVVFDLSGSNRFNVSFGNGRKSLVVTFEENTITDIRHETLANSERITIAGTLAPALTAFRMFSPERLVFDIPGAKYSAGTTETTIDGRFTQLLRAAQFDSQTARLVLELNENPQFDIAYEGTNAVITLTEPTYRNISYVQQPQPAVILKKANISASDVIHADDYQNGRYTLTLPGDYTSDFGYGEFEINDNTVKSVAISSDGIHTQITISEKAIYAYTVVNEQGDLVIKPVNPKSVYKTVVYVDAGHGNSDPGAVANGFEEKNLNLNIVRRLYELLEYDPEIKVYASRLDDSYPQNIDRALAANHSADLFVSVHHNSAETSKSNGTEVLYLNHAGEAYPRISSEAAARIFQTDLIGVLGTTDRGVVKRTNLIVLNQTTVPAVIVEVIFITNTDDINKVSTPEGRQLVAESLYRSIKEIFRQYPTGR